MNLLLEQGHETARETVKETIAALTAKLATMIPPTPPSGDMALLLADCRDTITEGIGALHTQGADVLHALQMLQAPPATPIHPKQPLWLAGAVGLVAGLVLMGIDLVGVARWRLSGVYRGAGCGGGQTLSAAPVCRAGRGDRGLWAPSVSNTGQPAEGEIRCGRRGSSRG